MTLKDFSLESFPFKKSAVAPQEKNGAAARLCICVRVLFKHFPAIPIPSVNKVGGGGTDRVRLGTEAARGRVTSVTQSIQLYSEVVPFAAVI